MKTKVIIAFIALMMASSIASAQTSLKGRVYYHPNIMEQAMGPEVDIDKKIAEARANAIAKKEKEKGRKLTKEEIAKLDKETANARKQAEGGKFCHRVPCPENEESTLFHPLYQQGLPDEVHLF